MKLDRSYETPLTIREVVISAGTEWSPQLPGWTFLQVKSSTGYWQHRQRNEEVAAGTVLVLSEAIRGSIRASQLGNLTLNHFWLDPLRLNSLLSFSERHFFIRAATHPQISLQIFTPNTPLAERFHELNLHPGNSNLFTRLHCLQLAAEVFRTDIKRQANITTGEDPADAKERLAKFLKQTPTSELLNLSFTDLVLQTRCTPRHLSRLFQEMVGMSFREKQAEVRLARARELLSTTESKIVDVALESGYQSLSLFNLMFKREFGVTPGKWRLEFRNRKLSKPIVSRARFTIV